MRSRRVGLALGVLAVSAGCAMGGGGAGHSSSPWELGGVVRAGALYPLDGGLSVGPMASYSYLRWDGGGGHDNLFEIGAHVRKELNVQGRAPWISAEAGFAHMKSVSDDFDASDSGWSAWLHGGLPVMDRIAVFAGAGATGLWDGTGKNVRAGLEFRP